MQIRRIAIIFDNTVRPETTGTHCLRALEELVARGKLDSVTHVLPSELERLAGMPADLYLVIDDGLGCVLPAQYRPAAYWTIDTHLGFEERLEQSHRFDFVFAAQKRGARELAGRGIRSARWLPLAANPAVHRKHAVTRRYDFAFVGNLFPGSRSETVALAQQYHRNSFVGRAYSDDMARTLSEAKIGLNPSIGDDVNMRFFEVPACGTFLLTNNLPQSGQAELLQPGRHIETYSSGAELLDKLKFYLARDELRERIAAAGQAEVLARHTYRHRMEEMLGVVTGAIAKCKLQNGNCKLSDQQPTTRNAGVTESAELGARSAEQIPSSPDPLIPSSFPPSASSLILHPSSFPYYAFSRPELLAHVPSWVRRALDLGCGAGAWGASLKERQPCHLTGVELCPEAAEAARRVLDEVHIADVETFDPPWTDGAFDHINIGDVLEHCRDPRRLLEEARHWLADSGQLVASIPNSRHHSLVASLVAGNWTLEPSGLLDATHLRFFTRREIEKLFYRSGYDVLKIEPVYAPGADAVRDASPPGEVHAGRLRLEGLTEAEADEFFAYQYLVKAMPARRARRGLTSIVIVTFNAIVYTRQFLESVRFYTDGRAEFGTPYELIFVDNGSSDGTCQWLESQHDVTLIANAENRGFPAAANQGYRASRGRQVLFINNDVLLTTGWLDRLLNAMYEEHERRQPATHNAAVTESAELGARSAEQKGTEQPLPSSCPSSPSSLIAHPSPPSVSSDPVRTA